MIALPPLPYELNALAPHISQETLEYHYGKHHKSYVTKLNELLANHTLKKEPLEDIIRKSEGKETAIFNNAAQIWNHTFYWHCLSPEFDQTPKVAFQKVLERDFGSLEAFKEQFTKSAVGNFGSGWTWLVKDKEGKLHIQSTSNAATPLTKSDFIPLLTCDVWEHAYYIDYRNARPDYLKAFWQVVNWRFVEENYQK